MKPIEEIWRWVKRLDIQLIILSTLILVMKLAIIAYPWPKLPPQECMKSPLPTDCALIFDEAHYIPAVRKIMMGEPANNEHPPLSKALMILGIILFGDNPIGWRIFMVISGAVSVYLLGKLAQILLKRDWMALISAMLFAFDITSFNLSSMALLDAPAMTFCLVSAILFLKGRYKWSAAAMGFAASAKTSSLLVLGALLLFQLVKNVYEDRGVLEAFRKWLPVFEKFLVFTSIIFLAGLAVYDYALDAYSTPFEHLDYMLNYHSILTFKEGDVVDMPLSWANPIQPFPRASYFVVTVKADGREYHPIAYYGMQSPLWWMAWLVAGFSAYMAYVAMGEGRFPVLEAFVLTWFASTYLVFFPLAHILHRWVYPFYFYMTVPAIAIGLPKVLGDDKLSQSILITLLIAQIAWFVAWFPVKPQWLIDFLLWVGAPA